MEGNSKQSKIFLDFSNIKPKIENKANQSKKTKGKQRETQEIFLVFLCFEKQKQEQEQEQQRKESETWIYKVPTKYDI
jgi:hypothetical protein